MEAFPYGLDIPLLSGGSLVLDDLRDRVLLIVNTASYCGFTPQYKGLQALHRDFADAGLSVLGFPCNQFGAQERGSAGEIQEFCRGRYAVDFPLASKIEVNGRGAHPLYIFLKKAAPGLLGTERIKWNFTKFLVGRGGSPVTRFAPQTAPSQLLDSIRAALG